MNSLLNLMKLKLFIFAFFAVLSAGFFMATPAKADSTWTFDNYTNGTNIDADAPSNWSYVYGQHMQIKNSNASSTPNSLAATLSQSANSIFTSPTTFARFSIDYKDVLSSGFGVWSMWFGNTATTTVSFKITFGSNGSYGVTLSDYGGQNSVSCGTMTANTYGRLNIQITTTQARCSINSGAWSGWHNSPSGAQYLSNKVTFDFDRAATSDSYFDNLIIGDYLVPFAITSPANNEYVVDDDWTTISGTCPTNGSNEIGFTDDCLGFNNIVYNVACVNNTFTGNFYHRHGNDQLIARDKHSVSGDCVDYDALMAQVGVRGLEIINGYPDDWYFDFNYYNNYDIKINYPTFDMPALTLPAGSTNALFSFAFTYPTSSLANMNFNIKEYKSDGTLVNGAYHNKNLSAMANTQDYQVSLTASSTEDLHYVVQLTESGQMKRQYPFMIAVSDLSFESNSSSTPDYFFPRLVAELKKKAIFNYYFAFHDGFYNMFNAASTVAGSTALDLTFYSMSNNLQYTLPIKILSFSDKNVINFANSLRPYITAILWILFALYVFFRFSRLFGGGDE